MENKTVLIGKKKTISSRQAAPSKSKKEANSSGVSGGVITWLF